jgi:AcrR family transcriptional regulator
MCIHLYINLRGYDAPTTPYARRPRVIPNPQPQLQDDHGPGRKASISREDLMAAALKLVGPHRSVSSLSLREVAREAGIAPNSFYRQFRDMDELAVALIDLAGRSLRKIIGEARHRATSSDRSVVRGSVEAFMEQLRADDKLLHVLLREGNVGSDAFKHAVERELQFFEEELCMDLVRLATRDNAPLHEPALVSKAITRLVFAMGATAMDLPPEKDPELIEQLSEMVRLIITGSRALASRGGGR